MIVYFKTWTKWQVFTCLILMALIATDFVQAVLVTLYENSVNRSVWEIYIPQIKIWIIVLYWSILIGIPIVGLVIRINRDCLPKMNIDKFYIVMLIIATLLIIYTVPYNVFAVITFLYLGYILLDKKVKFSVIGNNWFWILLLLAVMLVGVIVSMLVFFEASNINLFSMEQSLRRFVLEIIPITIYEEVVYRGMLQMVLKDLGTGDFAAFTVQALLFWMKHINYLFASPISFWLFIPILSLILGYVVYRSKSLTLSTFLHILYNFFAFYF